jgi:hypothetical protein
VMAAAKHGGQQGAPDFRASLMCSGPGNGADALDRPSNSADSEVSAILVPKVVPEDRSGFRISLLQCVGTAGFEPATP